MATGSLLIPFTFPHFRGGLLMVFAVRTTCAWSTVQAGKVTNSRKFKLFIFSLSGGFLQPFSLMRADPRSPPIRAPTLCQLLLQVPP